MGLSFANSGVTINGRVALVSGKRQRRPSSTPAFVDARPKSETSPHEVHSGRTDADGGGRWACSRLLGLALAQPSARLSRSRDAHYGRRYVSASNSAVFWAILLLALAILSALSVGPLALVVRTAKSIRNRTMRKA